MRRATLALCLFLAPSTALAQSAFCVTWAGGTQCTFNSAQDCRERARDLDGACVANAARQGSSENFWSRATRSYEAGQDARDEREVGAVTSRNDAWRQFCRDMTRQDSAELD